MTITWIFSRNLNKIFVIRGTVIKTYQWKFKYWMKLDQTYINFRRVGSAPNKNLRSDCLISGVGPSYIGIYTFERK